MRLEEDLAASLERARSATDRVTAFQRVSRLAEIFQRATTAGAEMRAAILAEIRDTGGLSLAQLGDKVALSKRRAQEITDAAKRKGKR